MPVIKANSEKQNGHRSGMIGGRFVVGAKPCFLFGYFSGYFIFYASHRPDAPHGRISPLFVTGRPISCDST